jgi:hypothetical protein
MTNYYPPTTPTITGVGGPYRQSGISPYYVNVALHWLSNSTAELGYPMNETDINYSFNNENIFENWEYYYYNPKPVAHDGAGNVDVVVPFHGWSQALPYRAVTSVQFKLINRYGAFNAQTGTSGQGTFLVQSFAFLPPPTVVSIGPLINLQHGPQPYARDITVNVHQRPGIVPRTIDILYRTAVGGSNQYTNQVSIDLGQQEANPPDITTRTFRFQDWSRFLEVGGVDPITFTMKVNYNPSLGTVGEVSSTYSFNGPSRTPVMYGIRNEGTSIPERPWRTVLGIVSPLPANMLHYRYVLTGEVPFNDDEDPVITWYVPAGTTFEISATEWSERWKTHNIWQMLAYVTTRYNTTWITAESAQVVIALPAIWPTWIEAALTVQHVRQVVLDARVHNVGRPLMLGQLSQIPPGETVISSIDWGAIASHLTPPEQHLYWGVGEFADGTHSLTFGTMVKNTNAGGTLVDHWGGAPSTVVQRSVTVATKPTLQTIYLEATADRLGARVGIAWIMGCAGRGVEVEWQSGQMEEWQPLISIGGEAVGGADTYQAGAVKSFVQEYVDQAADIYYYRARSFYRTSETTTTYGTWSDAAQIAVDVSFGMAASSYEELLTGYASAEISAYWQGVNLTYGEVEQITLWVREAGSEDWTAIWAGAPDSGAGVDSFQATSIPPITLARNSTWEYTITDGARPPNEEDLVGELVFADGVELVVETAQLENEDEFA